MMTEIQYRAEIGRLEAETKRLGAEKRALMNLAWAIREFCPHGEHDKRRSHEWATLRADAPTVIVGGRNTR